MSIEYKLVNYVIGSLVGNPIVFNNGEEMQLEATVTKDKMRTLINVTTCLDYKTSEASCEESFGRIIFEYDQNGYTVTYEMEDSFSVISCDEYEITNEIQAVTLQKSGDPVGIISIENDCIKCSVDFNDEADIVTSVMGKAFAILVFLAIKNNLIQNMIDEVMI